MKKAWHIWLKISKSFMNFGANIALIFIYIVLIIPLGYFLRLFYNRNLLGHGYNENNDSYWVKHTKTVKDMNWAREQ